VDDGLPDLLHRVVFLLAEAARRNDTDLGGLTYSQMRLLGALEDIEPATQHRLAQAMSVSDPAISRALRPLEADGFVEVRTDPDHARRRLVSLTEAGRAAYHRGGRPAYDQLRKLLVEAGFPYERYVDDTLRLADLLSED
jgi:DNA-binding MarR family transcriptional regulator